MSAVPAVLSLNESFRRDRWAYLLALVPLLAGAVGAGTSDWRPQVDTADTSLKSWDIAHGHWALLGHWTTGGLVANGLPRPHHPGPIQSYLLAPFVWVSGGEPWGLILGGLLLMAVLAVVTVRAAGILGGARLALAIGVTLAGCAAFMGRLATLPWNPFPTMYALPACALLVAVLARGGMSYLPVFSAVLAVGLQGHASAVPFGAVALALAGAFTLTRWWTVPPARRVRILRSSAWAGLVSVVLWLPALAELVKNDPNNLDLILDFASAPVGHRLGGLLTLHALTLVWGPGPLDILEGLKGFVALGNLAKTVRSPWGFLLLAQRPGTWLLGSAFWLVGRSIVKARLGGAPPAPSGALVAAGLDGTAAAGPQGRAAAGPDRRAAAGPQGPRQPYRMDGRVQALAIALVLCASTALSLSRADVIPGQEAFRASYVIVDFPLYLVTVVLTLWSAPRVPSLARRIRRRFPAPTPGRGGRLLPVVLALTVIGSFTGALEFGSLTLNDPAELKTLVRSAAGPGQRPAHVITSPDTEMLTSALVYELVIAGHPTTVNPSAFADSDMAFRLTSTPPAGALQVTLREATGPTQPASPGPGWTVVGWAQRNPGWDQREGRAWLFVRR